MATISRRAARVVKNIYSSGEVLPVRAELKEANTQVFKKGELVEVPTTGLVTRAAAIVGGGIDKLDVSAAAVTIARKILGIALKDATNVSSGNIAIPVALFVPGTVVRAQLVTGTDGDLASPGAIDYTLLATDMFRKVALLFDDTNDKWYFTVTALEEAGTIINFPGIASNDLSGGGVGDINAVVDVLLDQEWTKFAALVTAA